MQYMLLSRKPVGYEAGIVSICSSYAATFRSDRTLPGRHCAQSRQAVRNNADLHAMAVPQKYRALGDFHQYYSGERAAPYLTLFIGGNHEASNHLFDLYYGGWVAPNIYYLGAANVLRYGPLRIAGASGIWKGYNYRKPHYERAPYSGDDKRSVYHIRELDVRKLLQVRTQVDIGLSHDWPRGIEWKGDSRSLFRFKKHLEADAQKNELGSPAAKYLLDHLRPQYWFSAHLHCKYSAVINAELEKGNSTSQKPLRPAMVAGNGFIANLSPSNADEIGIDLDSDGDGDSKVEASEPAPAPGITVSDDLRARLPDSFKKSTTPAPGSNPLPSEIKNTMTRFLALDKCLPNRDFLQLLDVQPAEAQSSTYTSSDVPLRFCYDKEWLAITRVFSNELQGGPSVKDRGKAYYRPLIEESEKWVDEHFVTNDKMVVPENFEQTAPPHSPSTANLNESEQYQNPQTVAFCQLLDIGDPFDSQAA